MKKDKTDNPRVFFALRPDKQTVNAINYHCEQYSPLLGKKVVQENFHITLLFLGNVDHQTLDALCMDCDGIDLPSFTLTISQPGWWNKAGILWLAPDVTPPELTELVTTLTTFSARRKLTVEKRKYFPHITLMRKVTEAPEYPVVAPFPWQARDFCLMQSFLRPEGVQYIELARWPLL